MVAFEQLPDEIISKVIGEMSFNNKKRFSLVSKAMNALAVSIP